MSNHLQERHAFLLIALLFIHWDLLHRLFLGFCWWQDADGNDISIYVLKILCNDYDSLNPVIGESLQSSSPLDITFWPTHPGVDRLVHWKRIATVLF